MFSITNHDINFKMNRISLLSLLFTFTTCLLAQSELPKPKLSASALQYLWMTEHSSSKEALPEYVYKMDAQHQVYISTFTKVQPGFSGTLLNQIGAKTGTKAGNVWTVYVPVNQFKSFIQIPGISCIDMDQPSFPNLDTAKYTTHVDSVHAGINLPQKFNGSNVVVGIVDAGFDYTHPTFYDTAYASYRIKRVWEEKGLGTPPSGYAYGAEYLDSLSIVTKGYDVTTETHGTHVTGIAAGSGVGSPIGNSSKYRGMSYNSDIVLVGIYPSANYWLNTGMTDMLDGIDYVFNYAQSVSKPAVTNLSWGCPLGPHDGTSLFSEACDNITGHGKIFVLSAGNNGANNIHLKKNFTSTDSVIKTVLTFPSGLSTKKNWVDVWGESGKTFSMRFSLYLGNSQIDSSIWVPITNSTQQIYLKSNNGDTCFVTVTSVASEFNGKPHMLLNFYSRANITNRLVVSLKSHSGTVNMWQGYVLNASGYYGTFTKSGYSWATDGDSQMTISDMVTTHSAISVGAYCSKGSFTNVSGQTLSYSGYTRGAIAPFSSMGPTADNRIKPEITGPGFALASSFSSFDPDYQSGGASYSSVVETYTSSLNGKVYPYGMAAGTSMSGPAVSGIVGLLLQVDPNLDPYLVMNILTPTAIQDSYTGTIPAGGTNVWGVGKVNAYSAVKLALQTVGIYQSENNSLNCLLYPNPGNGFYSIEYYSETNEKISVKILNVMGQEISTQNWIIKQGNNQFNLNLENQNDGIYLVQLTGLHSQATIKIIKK